MTLFFSGLLLALFGLSLILITLSLRLLRGAAPAGEAYSSPARFFLIVLRVAIGWHCFVEGMDKVTNPSWSSESYLRESMGPASGAFRAIAGDRLVARLTVGEDGAFPAELERDWNNYVNAFVANFELTGDQIEKVHAILAERKKDTLATFAKAETVTKISDSKPDVKVDMTMKERLKEHERLLAEVRALESRFPTSESQVFADWKNAKTNLAKWRADLTRTLDAETAKLKKELDTVLKAEQERLNKSLSTLTAKVSSAGEELAALKRQIADETARLNLILTQMPEAKGVPFAWLLLEISDSVVKWSLVVLGGCLLLGLFSRATSFATVLLLFSFYAAMPPLPGWPESPRLEGHYLLINKTLIEVIALLALTFIPTGRWAGLDGLLGLCCSGKAQTPHQANAAAPQAPAAPT
jgi:uncharacterized membrane protein YphA (DoxX/SURF4 family)